MISQINGRVHTKNILPKHRTQSHSRPVLGHITGIHTVVIIIPIFTNGRKCRLNAVFSSIGLFAGMGKTGDLLFHLAGAQGEGCHGTHPR
ncbi:MAG TPA: hypothetical protein PKJ95_00010 [Atribacterota bacterium]|nr:hypothetical protein [Atribacterota bacterium]